MIGSRPVEQPGAFAQVDALTHNGVVVAFGEEWSTTPSERKLWYRVLDLQQTADEELETAWEDSTRWTRWYEVPYPPELRAIGMSLFNVDKTVDQRYATVAGRWKAVDDGDHLFLFRALDLTADVDDEPQSNDQTSSDQPSSDQPSNDQTSSDQPSDAIRVYATRYRLIRTPSPDAGTNRSAKGQEVTVPQLLPVQEARYRRSAVREIPFGDTDSQGTRDLGNYAFVEPTMEFSMLRPIDGDFAVTLTPSDLPGRMRWQFFCRARYEHEGTTTAAIAAYSILRDEDGWADLEEKAPQLNADPDDPYQVLNDQLFVVSHPTLGPLRMAGRPAASTFRLQEQSGPAAAPSSAGEQEEERSLSGQRVMLAMRVVADTDESAATDLDPEDVGANADAPEADAPTPGPDEPDGRTRLAVLDFALDDSGAADLDRSLTFAENEPPRLTISDVDFARSALWFNSPDDRVELTVDEQDGDSFAVQAWIRHDAGAGTLLCRGWDPGIQLDAWTSEATGETGAGSTVGAGWSIEWRPDRAEPVLAGIRVLGAAGASRTFRVEAPLPGSFTWHHVALVQDVDDESNAVLTLFVDGVEADSLMMESGEPGAVDGAVFVGGPPSPDPDESLEDSSSTGWLDFRIDQVVLTPAADQPSPDTIYYELDETARAEALGYWTFDRQSPEEPSAYVDGGADEVSQTAPLFVPSDEEFEQRIMGMSVGMGLLTIPEWDPAKDPNLFVGADGVVRLYLAAQPTDDDSGRLIPGYLGYDTTSTRARFGVDWQATGNAPELQTGQLVLQAREPGPIMNRAAVRIDEVDDDHVRLSITHPHQELEEVWDRLPKYVPDFIAVLNGQADAAKDAAAGSTPAESAPAEEDNESKDRPEEPPPPLTYDYLTDGPGKTSVPYRSEVVQAFATTLPDNGAEARVQPIPDGTAALVQQGNFTGWTRPPLMVSGELDGQVAATTPVSADMLDRLRIPGDFAVEAWIKPQGDAGRTRVVNWRQSTTVDGKQDVDGFALGVTPTGQFSLRNPSEEPDDPDPLALSQVDLGEGGTARQWLTAGGGTTFTAEFEFPDGGQGGGRRALSTLIGHREVTIDSAAIYAEAKRLRQAQIDDNSELDDDTRTEHISDLEAWQPTGRTLTVTLDCTARLGVDGRRVLFDIRHDVDRSSLDTADEDLVDLWVAYLTGDDLPNLPDVDWTIREAANEGFSFNSDRPGSDGADEAPGYLIDVAATARQGDRIVATITLDDTTPIDSSNVDALYPGPVGLRPQVTCSFGHADAEVVASVVAASTTQRWLVPSISSPGPVVGQVEQDDGWGPFTGPLHEIGIEGSNGWSFSFAGASGLAPALFTGTVDFEPMLGDRRYETARSITADNWLHVGVVCSDNFAVRFDGQSDRAVVADATGLNPDDAFTIDCVVVPAADSGGALFSKAVEIGDRAVSFRLSIDGRRAHLQYTIDVEGQPRVHDVWSTAVLDTGKPYHVVASVKLEDFFYPEKAVDGSGDPVANRFQYWVVHHGVWVWDITGATWLGGTPDGFGTGTVDRFADQVSAMFAENGLFAMFESLIGGAVFAQLLYSADVQDASFNVLGRAVDTEPNYDVRLTSTDGPAAIGAATGEDPERLAAGLLQPFTGLIGSVRMWQSSLPGSDLGRIPLEPGVPPGVDPPTAWWQFDENRGLQASDSAGGSTATLTREEMWVTTRATARLTLYVNGRAIPLRSLESENERAVDYGTDDQFTLGAIVDPASGQPAEAFVGLIDDVRLWRDIRTGEEMLDTMHTLLGGNEDDLAGWWPVSAGTGARIKDASLGGTAHLAIVTELTDPDDPGIALPAESWEDFWVRGDAAPIGDDLPQLRHLLGGRSSSWSDAEVAASPMSAEYGDIQTDEDGRVSGVQKRAAVLALAGSSTGWMNATGFKTGDLDLIYVGQAQSDPTLIGYIEGAPPIPSENLTRPYWKSPTAWDAYNDRTTITLRQAENTTTVYEANYQRGIDFAFAMSQGFFLEGEIDVGAGVAFGGFFQTKLKTIGIELGLGLSGSIETSLGWMRSFQTSIGTNHSSSNTLSLSGAWEPAGDRHKEIGRRYIPDNTGYALVKSGVANVYAMRLRRNGAMLGLTMSPDPDIPEDFNIITFPISNTYTKQGTLDGRIGLEEDDDWRDSEPGRGSYFKPMEAANLEAQIETYDAKLLAAYDGFAAGRIGRRSAGRHFSADDPAQDPQQAIEGRTVVPYDWERNINRRNIVNTYVWTASGGFFAEEVGTSIERTESSGGSYSFKGSTGLAISGKFSLGMGVTVGSQWDVNATFGGYINTTTTKTKTDGRDFGLDVGVNCDGLLNRFLGAGDEQYAPDAQPGKVSSYRFKSFYLVPEKSHFEDFWSRVVDPDWLESGSLDAAALQAAQGKPNHVWRVLHRVTYVQRVPSTEERPPPPPPRPTKTVVHQVPNWQNIKLALDVLRTRKAELGALTRAEQLAIAADELVRSQWSVLSPWWASMVAAEPGSDDDLVVAELRRRTFEYLWAYEETGLLELDPRLEHGPLPPIDGPPPEEPPELPPLDSLEDGADDALHLFTFSERNLGIDQRGGEFLEYVSPTTIAHDDVPDGLRGRLVLPGPSATRPAGRAKISLSGDWGRVDPRTWEVCFRLSEAGPVVILAPTMWVPETQRPFRWLAIDGERNDDRLAIWPIGADESVSLPGVDVNSVGKLVYMAIGYTPPVEASASDEPSQAAKLEVAWAVEGGSGVQRRTLPTEAGDLAGGPMTLGGSGQEQFGHDKTRGSLEILHLAVHDEVFSAEEVARRLRAIGL